MAKVAQATKKNGEFIMRKIMIATAAAAFAVAAPAYAQTPTIIFNNGVFTVPSGYSAAVFQNFELGTGTNTAYVPAANETVSGIVNSQSGNIPGTTVDPDGTPGNKYISIGGANPIAAGSYQVNLAAPVQFFSFVLGSLDSYNSLTLFFSNSTSKTYTGREIIGDTVIGPLNSNTSGRVSFDLGVQPGITGALFSSGQAAFEIDDLASAVPEPATWGMMILGFGVIGGQLRSRRRQKTTLAVA